MNLREIIQNVARQSYKAGFEAGVETVVLAEIPLEERPSFAKQASQGQEITEEAIKHIKNLRPESANMPEDIDVNGKFKGGTKIK